MSFHLTLPLRIAGSSYLQTCNQLQALHISPDEEKLDFIKSSPVFGPPNNEAIEMDGDRKLSPGEVPEEPPVQQESEFMRDLNIHLMCPDCKKNPPNIVEEFSAGDLVCGDCGIVLSQRIIDTRSEWRTFSSDLEEGKDASRVGKAGIDGEELHTRIGNGGSGERQALRRAQQQAISNSRERRQHERRTEIRDLCVSGRLSSEVSQYAEALFVKSYAQLRIQPVIAHQAACIFIACRKTENPRSFKEVAEICNSLKLSTMNHAFQKLEHFMKERSRIMKKAAEGVATLQEEYTPTIAATADQYVARFCNKLGLEAPVILKVEDCARTFTKERILENCATWTIAGVAIFVVSHLQGVPRSTDEIAGVLKCHHSTIWKGYERVYSRREQWLKDSWITRGGGIHLLPRTQLTDEVDL